MTVIPAPPVDWQRHYQFLSDLVDAGGHLPDITPGVLMDGDNLGRWPKRQTWPATWKQLSTGQQERLSRLGVQSAQAPPPAPAPRGAAKGVRTRPSRSSSGAWPPSRNGPKGRASGRSPAVAVDRSRLRAGPSRCPYDWAHGS
jgi:hypothetical protein